MVFWYESQPYINQEVLCFCFNLIDRGLLQFFCQFKAVVVFIRFNWCLGKENLFPWNIAQNINGLAQQIRSCFKHRLAQAAGIKKTKKCFILTQTVKVKVALQQGAENQIFLHIGMIQVVFFPVKFHVPGQFPAKILLKILHS